MEIGSENLWRPLLLALSGTGSVWIATVFALKHPFREEIVLSLQGLRRALMTSQVNAGWHFGSNKVK